MHQLKDLRGRRVVASDGAAGVLHDVFFDASQWKVRYLAVESGARTTMDRLLVPAARAALQADSTISALLRRSQFGPRPGARSLAWLWSGRELTRYAVHGTDGPAGEVDDVVVGGGWLIAAIAVRGALGQFSGSRVSVDARDVARIDRAARTLHVRLARGAIARLPRLSVP
jgi:hypothetical protein